MWRGFTDTGNTGNSQRGLYKNTSLCNLAQSAQLQLGHQSVALAPTLCRILGVPGMPIVYKRSVPYLNSALNRHRQKTVTIVSQIKS